MQRRPDRTGIFITPLCALLAAVIASAMLVHALFTAGKHASWRRPVIDSMVEALATKLGTVGTAIVCLAMVVPSVAWFGASYKRYRARVAEDKRAMR